VLTAFTRLGRYEIVTALGAGGMGEVYRARDLRLGREVAVKILPEPFANDPARRARFELEAQAVAALSHPNILAIHDYGTHEGAHFAVMELLQGETLRGRIKSGPLPWRQAVEIGAAIAQGLAAAHAKGIVHRDIKPENLFLTADGQVKILDFGLARVEVEASPDVATGPYHPGLTSPGAVLGTVGYMSPEQARGESAGPLSDLFSLGCVLYEMVTGRRAFVAATRAETIAAILGDEPPELAPTSPSVPPQVQRVIRHCLEKNLQQRVQSAQDLAFDLKSILAASDAARAVGIPPQATSRRQPWWFHRSLQLTVALSALVLLVSTIWFLAPRGAQDAPAPESGLPTAEVGPAIAVLPFRYEGADADIEFLAHSIADSLSSRLARIRSLQVRPAAAIAQHAGKGEGDLFAVGRALRVQSMITGKVQKHAEQVVITWQLVDVGQKVVRDGATHRRPVADLFRLQEELAKEIADKLQLVLTGAEAQQLAQRPTDNLEAYRHYILGRVEWERRTPQALEIAQQHFERAIALAPAFAEAHAALAYCLITRAERSLLKPAQAYPQAQDAARAALKRDPALADGHVALAMTYFEYDWKFDLAERDFQRALSLSPNHPTGHQWYAELLSALGRHKEAVSLVKRAQELQGDSLIIRTIVGVILFKARRFDEAIGQFRQVLLSDEQFRRARGYLIDAYEQKGMFPEAAREWENLLGVDKEMATALLRAYESDGARGYWRKRLDHKDLFARHHPVSEVFTAGLHARLGDKKQALEILQELVASRDGALAPNLLVHPCFDELRSDPEFIAILHKVSLQR
jgi:TolB-like protein/Tfp pilus assembly protein PilF